MRVSAHVLSCLLVLSRRKKFIHATQIPSPDVGLQKWQPKDVSLHVSFLLVQSRRKKFIHATHPTSIESLAGSKTQHTHSLVTPDLWPLLGPQQEEESDEKGCEVRGQRSEYDAALAVALPTAPYAGRRGHWRKVCVHSQVGQATLHTHTLVIRFYIASIIKPLLFTEH
jgi:hypothetical protein